MPYATRPDSLDGAPSGVPYDMLPAIVFLDRLRNRASPPHKGDWPCFFICPSDAVPDVPQWRIGTVYGLGYWRICEKMLPSRSSPCWAALAYQRADSVASCGTPKPTS